MQTEETLKKIKEFLKDKSGGIVLAFSGGSDSLGLLILLARLKKPEELTAVYVDHGIRPRAELDSEIKLNRENCQVLGTRLEVCTLGEEEVRKLARQKGSGLEESARALRYEALEKKRKQLGFKWIATAHTLDDQAETLIMRLFSGKAFVSLQGIKKVNGNLIRPALDCKREELAKICEEAGLRWSLDSTNEQDCYLRNKVRHHLIPEIQKLFPYYREALSFLSLRAFDLAKKADEALGDPSEGLSLSLFQGLDDLQKEALLYQFWAKSLGENFVSLASKTALRILEAVQAQSPKGVLIEAGGVCASISRGKLFVCPDIKQPFWSFALDLAKENQTIELPGNRILTVGKAYFDFKNKPLEGVFLSPLDFEGEAVIRQIRKGDRIRIKGGRKKVSDLLEEMGIPRAKRGFVPLICDSKQVLAVMGKSFGGKDRFFYKDSSALAPRLLNLYIVKCKD